MGWIRSEEEVDKLIEEMLTKGKGKYVTQGVAFNKESPRQMDLLRKTLMSSTSFGGYVKDMLAHQFNGDDTSSSPSNADNTSSPTPIEEVKKKDTGNFI